MNYKNLLTTKKFAKKTGLLLRTVQRMAERGEIGFRIGWDYYFEPKDADSQAVKDAKKRQRST